MHLGIGRRLEILLLFVLAAAHTGTSCKPAPYDQELLANPGFEDGVLAPWQVDFGSCEVEHGPSFPLADAFAGAWLFGGGDDGFVGSCRAHQEIDVAALGFPGAETDTSRHRASGAAALRNRENAGKFDDQVFYRLRYLDGAGDELGSLRTLVAGDDAWLVRELSGLLPPGTRRIRAELEARWRRGDENDGYADDTSLAIALVTPADPQITKGPMLQDVRQDAMTVLWETDANLVAHAVEYGPAGGPLTGVVLNVETTQVDASHFVHKAVIPGLSAETDYLYRVRSGATASGTFEFRTAPLAATPFRVAWFADNQNGPGVLQGLVLKMVARDPDLVIVPGDHVQNGDQLGDWQVEWFDPMSVGFFGQTTPVMLARGNHDGEHAVAYAYSALPHNESWYAFRYGNTFFVALDTEAPTSNFGGEEDPADFLNAALASPEAQAAEFRVVYFHKPPYTNLWDASNVLACLFGSEYDGQANVRADWVGLFENHDVDLVVSGHTHSYQHGFQNGVHYLLVGGGGGALDTVRGCGGSTFWTLIDTEHSEHHYNVMDVSGNVLSWTAYDQDDAVLHGFQVVH